MPLVVNTNIASLNAQRHLSINTLALNKNLEKLASGFRINRAADDAAGLQISETFRAQIRGISAAIGNAEDGNNLLSVAEGTLGVIQENLQRVRELTVQAANETNGTNQLTAIRQEINARLNDIDRIANATEFNGKKLLAAAGVPATVNIQVGQNNVVAENAIDIRTALGDSTTGAAGINVAQTTGVNFSTNANINAYLATVDTALTAVSTKRATIGSFQNRFEGAISNLQITRENLAASDSRIRNVDVAAESADWTRNQILQQASASILAQANQAPSLALSLLGR